MKKLFLLLLLTISNISISQTVIQYDNMETWSWTGYWAFATPVTPVGANLFPAGGASGWATNASVSSNESARIYGSGNGNSGIEQNWYVLPNITGLDPNKLYQFKFRLASYKFSSPTAGTSGVDNPDFVDVQVSTDGGINYISELRITGNNGAYWDYNTNGIITHTADGTFNSALNTSGGDVYRSGAGNQQTVGYSVISLDLPFNISQVAVDILCRVNSAGEEWWLDNIELLEINPLPVELYSFEGSSIDGMNLITWSTASEHNSDYFVIEKSVDGENWTNISKVPGSGNSNTLINYSYLDNSFIKTINYYKLRQVDFDGANKAYGPIMVDNRSTKIIVKCVNLLGQEVDENTKGIIILIYQDGSMEKVVR